MAHRIPLRIVVLAGVLLAGIAPSAGAMMSNIRGADDSTDGAESAFAGGRGLLAGTGDLLRQMHRMRHQDHTDEGLNLTRSQLAGRVSKMNNRTKARLIKVKKAAAPPKNTTVPKNVTAPSSAAAGANSSDVAFDVKDDLDLDDEWTDDDFDDFNEDDYLEDLLKECAKDKAVAIFSCDAKYAELCKVAVTNLEAMGIGHLAIASDEDVCDTLGYDDPCCTVAEDMEGSDQDDGVQVSMYAARWQYLEIALGFNFDVIMQDCDVLWTKNPVEDFRSDPEVGIIGMRERDTNFPFNAGLTWFRADRAAVTRVVRDINERMDFFTGVADEPYRLEEIGIGSKCLEAEHMPKLMLDKSIYNDALESSALNDDVYTRSRMSCDDDGRDKQFNCLKGFPETGCLLLEPEFGSGDGFANFKSRNGKTIKCSTDEENADPDDDATGVAVAVTDPAATAGAGEKTEEGVVKQAAASKVAKSMPSTNAAEAPKKTVPVKVAAPVKAVKKKSTVEDPLPSGAKEEAEEEATERRRLSRRSSRRHLLASPRALLQHRRAVLQEQEQDAPGGASASASASDSDGDDDDDFTERPAKACVAADDVLASWSWSEAMSGEKGGWSMKNPVALGYHFVDSGGKFSAPAKITMMKKVLES